MNTRFVFSQMFIKRGFLGLLAFAWGFMLGGSLLMTAVTYGLALTGSSHYSVAAYQFAMLVMLLPIAWLVMEHEYQNKGVTNIKTFVAAFLVALFFGTVMPIVSVIGAFVTWREMFRRKTVPTNDPKALPHKLAKATGPASRPAVHERRGGLTGFLQDLMNRSFLKLAH